ncbi:hypothetical protein CR513_12888, partial [Mucuna pruriens]
MTGMGSRTNRVTMAPSRLTMVSMKHREKVPKCILLNGIRDRDQFLNTLSICSQRNIIRDYCSRAYAKQSMKSLGEIKCSLVHEHSLNEIRAHSMKLFNQVRLFTMSKMDWKPMPLHHSKLDLSLLIGGGRDYDLNMHGRMLDDYLKKLSSYSNFGVDKSPFSLDNMANDDRTFKE